MRRLLVLSFSTIALAGCGGSQDPIERSFGGLSDLDELAVDNYFEKLRGTSETYARLVAELDDPTSQAARAALDRFEKTIADGRKAAAVVTEVEVRGVLEDYVDRLDGVARVLERAAAGVPGDVLLNDYRRAVRRAQAGDRLLLDRISGYLDDEGRRRLQDQLDDQQKEFDRITGG